MKKNNSALFSVFATGVMLLLLYSMHAYFLWWVYDGMAYIFIIECVVAFIGLSYINKNRIPVRFNSKVLIPFFCVWFVEALNPNGIAWVLSRCPFTLLIILLLDRLTLQKLLKIWTNLYAIILSVSLIAWLLAMQGVLPSYGTISFGNDISYVYQNHILCLVNMNLHNFDVIRFCSIFLEPGHLSMIGAFTLYANRYNFKEWTTWPILIASLASLALAGYILIIIGYLMIRLQKSTLMQELWSIVMSAVLLISAYYITISYNNGNNFVNEMIIQRTEFDSEKGIVGNNRTSMETDNTFDNFVKSADLLTGFDFATCQKYLKNETISGAGYKMYLMEKGILGILLALLAYFIISRKSQDKRFMFYFLLFYIISFMQRAWPTSHIWLYLFIFATAEQRPYENNRKFLKSKNGSIIYN